MDAADDIAYGSFTDLEDAIAPQTDYEADFQEHLFRSELRFFSIVEIKYLHESAKRRLQQTGRTVV